MRYFNAFFCHYPHIKVYRNKIRLINADLSYLQQHAWNLRCFLLFYFLQISYNQWQNIIWILKRVFKLPPFPLIQCCEPIILLNASFAHCSTTLLRGGRGEKYAIVQIAVFPIIFVSDCLKNLQNFKCRVLLLLILNQVEVMYLPIMSLL